MADADVRVCLCLCLCPCVCVSVCVCLCVFGMCGCARGRGGEFGHAGVSTLRLMRAFRVMRLFGRLESLRQIITALTSSMIPVGNALLIMLLITSIYAILAVNFFSHKSPEFFGSFSKALFTLFQVCTGDGWASDIARPIFDGADNPEEAGLDAATAGFFVSFVVIVAWTLLQVVVAVLLDNFTAAADMEKQRKAQAKAKEEGRAPVVYAIDPLLAALAHFVSRTLRPPLPRFRPPAPPAPEAVRHRVCRVRRVRRAARSPRPPVDASASSCRRKGPSRRAAGSGRERCWNVLLILTSLTGRAV